MFKETYVAKWREWRELEKKGNHIEVVNQVSRSVLAPPQQLVADYKKIREENDKLQNETVREWWDDVYFPTYMEHIGKSNVARARIDFLWEKELDLRKKGEGLDVYLVCYEGPKALQGTRHCHRFILLDILDGKIKL